MTGSLCRSAFVAAVFAIHPLRAESVAWISERKDVLSAFFFMLTLAAYVRYVRRPPSMIRYGAGAFLHLWPVIQKHAGDDALRLPAAGLLAAEPSFRLLPPGFAPAGGRENPTVCADGRIVRGDSLGSRDTGS